MGEITLGRITHEALSHNSFPFVFFWIWQVALKSRCSDDPQSNIEAGPSLPDPSMDDPCCISSEFWRCCAFLREIRVLIDTCVEDFHRQRRPHLWRGYGRDYVRPCAPLVKSFHLTCFAGVSRLLPLFAALLFLSLFLSTTSRATHPFLTTTLSFQTRLPPSTTVCST